MPLSAAQQAVEDYTNTLFAEHEADPDPNKEDVPEGPTFLMPICWIALHEYASAWILNDEPDGGELEEELSFIYANSETVGPDYPDGGYTLYAFDTDPKSIDAMQRLEAIAGDAGIYIRKKDDGHYLKLDKELKEDLGLKSPYFLNWQDPDVLRTFITNFTERYNKRFPSAGPALS